MHRSLSDADWSADEHNHVPVRWPTLYVEGSLDYGTPRLVFEPNDNPLWDKIHLSGFREATMAKSTADNKHLDPYKNSKLRVKWESRYVRAVSFFITPSSKQ